MIVLDISEYKEFQKKLEQLHLYAYPSVVRATLTSAAFTAKTKTVDREAKKQFTRRESNFFRANSTFIKASGNDISRMKSTVGMFENKLSNKSTNYAVKDLEQQEDGGNIGGRSFIPMKQARAGGRYNGKIKTKYRLKSIKRNKFISVNDSDGRSKKQQFVRASIVAVTKGDGYVLGHKTSSGGRTLFKIDFIRTSINKRRFQMKFTPIYNVKKNRKVKVDSTNFMEKSAIRASKIMPQTFKKESERQFKKYLR